MATVKCPQCAFQNPIDAQSCQQCKAPLPRVSFRPSPPPGSVSSQQSSTDGLQFTRGQVVNNRYAVLGMVGRGGMGCIYKVHDNVLGEELALKTLLPQFTQEKLVVERFLNEARITRRLTHPNIVRVHDIGSAGRGIFISMEYVQGQSLREILKKLPNGQRLPLKQTLYIIDQLCVALDYAHRYTVHRDIKPENVMITPDNQIKLMDFGISKLMDNRFSTSASVVMGTPFYMSPEQLKNTRDVDARADIYSVGIMLYEMLTGSVPTGVPKPVSEAFKDIPPVVDDVLKRCIEADREKRFKNAAEMRAALLPVIALLEQGKDPGKYKTKQIYKKAAAKSEPGKLWSAVAIVLILTLTGAALWALEAYHRQNADMVPGGSIIVRSKGSLDDLKPLTNKLKKHILALPQQNSNQQQWLQEGDALWDQALSTARSDPAQAQALAENALQHYLAVLLCPEDMVFVPAGKVQINSSSLQVPGFFMDREEVTVADFTAFCQQVSGGWTLPTELSGDLEAWENYPVPFVSWFDAQAFAAWKGRLLPTREQWARAAYGDGNGSHLYPWGDEWKSGAANVQTGQSAAVKSFPEDLSWSGCYDLAGNLSEWLRPSQPDTTPTFGMAMPIGGGNFTRQLLLHESDTRLFQSRSADLGFRCAWEVPSTPEAIEAALERLH
jgi:serine/threonine protein kinase